MTWAPVERLAIHLDSNREMIEPPKPKMAAITSKPAMDCGFTPNTAITTLTSASTARLVARNSTTRFIMVLDPFAENVAALRQLWGASSKFKPDVHANPSRPTPSRAHRARAIRTLAHRPAAL